MVIKTNKIKSRKNRTSTSTLKQKQVGGANDRYGYLEYNVRANSWSYNVKYITEPTHFRSHEPTLYLLDYFRKKVASNTSVIVSEFCDAANLDVVRETIGDAKCTFKINDQLEETIQNNEIISLIRVKSDLQLYHELSKTPPEHRFSDDGYLYIIIIPGYATYFYKYCKIPENLEDLSRAPRRFVAPDDDEGLELHAHQQHI